MDIGHVKFISPARPELKKWIKGYYVHSSSDPNFYSKVTFYQNITTTISIYKDSRTSSKGRLRKQEYQKGKGYTSLLVGLVDKYQEVEFFGPLDRVAIVFYPGGINNFIKQPVGEMLRKHYSHFHYFDVEFRTLLPEVFGEATLEGKQILLDQFFSNQLAPLSEQLIQNAIEILTQSLDSVRVEELSSRLGVSRRTLLRKFKKHLGYSVEEYKQVIKFRRALLNFQETQKSENLAQIALQSHYYDQPDFNHHIKTQSDLTPKELFKQLEIIDNTLFWKL